MKLILRGESNEAGWGFVHLLITYYKQDLPQKGSLGWGLSISGVLVWKGEGMPIMCRKAGAPLPCQSRVTGPQGSNWQGTDSASAVKMGLFH